MKPHHFEITHIVEHSPNESLHYNNVSDLCEVYHLPSIQKRDNITYKANSYYIIGHIPVSWEEDQNETIESGVRITYTRVY